MQTVSTIGLDIAKSVFQVHGVDPSGQVVDRNADQPDLSSLAPSQIPRISCKPSELTALATSRETLQTSPAGVRVITMSSR
jgi:hypothetical protein